MCLPEGREACASRHRYAGNSAALCRKVPGLYLFLAPVCGSHLVRARVFINSLDFTNYECEFLYAKYIFVGEFFLGLL